jgi:CBS-domain-containing membrane protein
MEKFSPLPLSTLKPRTGYCRPYFYAPNLVKVTSSALEVMTDLRYVPAAVIQDGVDVETATQKMIARGVRALLVVDSADDVVGIVTARDLIGDRLLHIQHQTGKTVSDIKVADIMTGHDQIEVLPLDSVLHAHVGDIVETLKYSGRQHALVVEVDPYTEKASIRGLFSSSQIARQLGIGLQTHELSHTFEQIDLAIRSQSDR